MNRYNNGNNKLVTKYNKHIKSNLNDNSMIKETIKNNDLHNKINMANMEQIKNKFGMDNTQLIEYIINPITINKPLKNEFEHKVKDLENTFIKLGIEWQNTRTNQPYKNIIKDEKYKKEIKNENDLIIHKVSKKDKENLLEEYNQIMNILEKHNNEIQMVYSISEKNKHKKDFEYIQKYKYNVTDDPTNNKDLKDLYLNEQKKISKEKHNIENIINEITDNDILYDDFNDKNNENRISDELKNKYKNKDRISDELKNDYKNRK